jgi:heme/copper-type cytochrome/quinol oxidase subunit 2
MENEILDLIQKQDQKIDAIYKSVEKTRKYILVVTIITIIAVVLPVIGMLFAVPSFINSYTEILSEI